VTRGTLEEQVLRLLDEKISMFELVVGEVVKWGRSPAGTRWACLGNRGKEVALLELLWRNSDEKKLVFVHYRETLDHLADAPALCLALSHPIPKFGCMSSGGTK
jgi:hypothetical protein